MKRVLAVVSDLHCGSTVGLCSPDPVTLDDGGSYTPSPAQRWLYDNWLEFWRRVRVARRGATSFGILLNGDLVDGDHHGTPQVVSRDPNVQMWILKEVFKVPLALKPDFVTVVRGTESHVGKGAATEESFSRWLKGAVTVPQDPATGMYSWWHLNLILGGLRIDAAHHGRIGGRPWTMGSAVNALASQIVLEHANRGDPIPDLAFRSHYHTFFDTGPHNPCRTRLIQTPAWQLHTAFTHKVVPECLSDIGGIIVTLEDDKAPVVEPVLFKPTRSQPVRIA